MVRRGSAIQAGGILTMAALMANCASVTAPPLPMGGYRFAVPVLPVPADVRRLAVLYPRGENQEWSGAYSRLEGAAFQLKAFRRNLKIIDRSHMPAIVLEHRFQDGGLVLDESAVRMGQLLGVDSVLIYRIDGPTLRDRFWARQHRDLPPVTVMSKIIRVESAEVVYHNVVTARVDEAGASGWSLSDHVDYQRWSREAVERGVMQTVDDLRRAFE